MTVDQAIEIFRNYSRREKIDFLFHLAHALTILARDTYEARGEGLSQPARLRRITEVQHRVLSGIIALMKNEAKRYPDEVLVRLVLEHPADRDLQQQLEQAFSQLTEQMAVITYPIRQQPMMLSQRPMQTIERCSRRSQRSTSPTYSATCTYG